MRAGTDAGIRSRSADEVAPDAPTQVRAAGALPWRVERGVLRVAVVHRPEYDDWSWAKGKLDKGESWPQAAVREVEEETGLRVRLGIPLPSTRYVAGGKTKEVRYWAAQVVGGSGELENEIDDLRWVTPAEAARLLTYSRDHDQLDALVRLRDAGVLESRVLIVQRHAHARPRKSWSGDDRKRTLDELGEAQAQALAPIIDAYGVTKVVSSPSRRCVDTVRPFCKQAGVRMQEADELSEEGHEAHPRRAARLVDELLRDGRAHTVVCSHGPVLPAILTAAQHRAAGAAQQLLQDAVENNLRKGEALVLHLVGDRVIDAARHMPDA